MQQERSRYERRHWLPDHTSQIRGKQRWKRLPRTHRGASKVHEIPHRWSCARAVFPHPHFVLGLQQDCFITAGVTIPCVCFFISFCYDYNRRTGHAHAHTLTRTLYVCCYTVHCAVTSRRLKYMGICQLVVSSSHILIDGLTYGALSIPVCILYTHTHAYLTEIVHSHLRFTWIWASALTCKQNVLTRTLPLCFALFHW